MDTKIDKFSNALKENLAVIRSAVGKLFEARPRDANKPVDLVAQGDRMVQCCENWLLDDEQQQMFSLQPLDRFILYASSYLCDIGLMDDNGLPLSTNGNKDVPTRTFFNHHG